EYILAAKAYRVTRQCMTPYKKLIASQVLGGYREFNLHHSATRIKIKHSFGILKN
ncbi:hypothetical protein C7212DRAFT_223364, partial [Tuber magnatum]